MNTAKMSDLEEKSGQETMEICRQRADRLPVNC